MSINKFKIGDKVKVIDNIEAETKIYGDIYFASDMEQYKSKILTIVGIAKDLLGEEFYQIKEDNQRWFWDDDMLDLVEDEYESKTINCIDVILKELGLEKKEEFEISMDGLFSKVRLTDSGLINEDDFFCNTYFVDLIIGQAPYRKIKPIQKPTEEEQKYLDAAKKLGFKWVAKDEDDQIYFYEFKPLKNDYHWYVLKENEKYGERLESKIDFKFLSWEDKEPYEIK